MQFIPETTIDTVVGQLESLDDYDDLITELGETQPAVLAYLMSDNFKFFTDAERDFAFFLTFAIWKSVDKHHPDLTILTEEQIGKNEESNWDLFDEQKARSFKEKLNAFFKGYDQEDLLAFVEDALEPDEEAVITPEGRDYLFVAMKSVIDAMRKNA